MHTSEPLSTPENNLIGFANDSTVLSAVSSPGIRVTVAESMNRDLVKVSEWCNLWGMKFNANKSMRVSMSRTMHPSHPPSLTIGGTCWRSLVTLIYWECIWFKDDFWEVSSFGVQSSFSKAWYLEHVLASIPRYIASWEMHSKFCPARFGVLFCSVVLGCRCSR